EAHLTAIIERIAPSSVIALALGTTGSDTFVDRIRTLQLAVHGRPCSNGGPSNFRLSKLGFTTRLNHSDSHWVISRL
ncbi:MAG: hypothetical protein WCG09_09555, partial [Halobacteriota archaeon]